MLETNCDAGNEDWLDNLVAVTLASKFSMLHININSLLGPAKFAAARSVLDSKKFDLICLQETKIGSDTPNSLLEATGYSMIRRDRLSGSDGILIYIKTAHKIIHSQIDPQFETITFSLLLGHKHINFISSTWRRSNCASWRLEPGLELESWRQASRTHGQLQLRHHSRASDSLPTECRHADRRALLQRASFGH